MDTRLLRSFVTVAECLNFTEAARRLFLSQSTLSGQISSLEGELGFALFKRDRRSVDLTPAGARFLPDAYALLQAQARALRNLDQLAEDAWPVLHLGFLSGPFTRFLPQAVRTYRQLRPQAQLELVGDCEKNLQAGLLEGRFDLVLTVDWAAGLHFMQDGAFLEIDQERFCAILPPDHPLAAQKQVALKQLRDEPFIILDRRETPQHYAALVRSCNNQGFFPRISGSVLFLWDMFMLVELGQGVALAAESLCRNCSSLCVRPLADPILGGKSLAVWKQSNGSPALKAFVQVCRQLLADSGTT